MKLFYLSKTFWFNILVLLTMMFPSVAAWVSGNPETFAGVWAAANIILRWVTSGRLSLTTGDSDAPAGPGMVPLGLVACTMAGLGLSLPSCSPATAATIRAWPIKSCVLTDAGTLCYSAKGGLEVTVDATSRK